MNGAHLTLGLVGLAAAGAAVRGSAARAWSMRDLVPEGADRADAGGDYADYKLGDAWVELRRYGDEVELANLWIEKQGRGQGGAKLVLRELTNAADRFGITLTLEVEPEQDEDEDFWEALDRVASLYRRFGFQAEGDMFLGSRVMKRSPR